MISINYRDPTPIYGQVKEGFIRLIITGALKTDEQLPSVRELAAQLSINPNTIQSAYRELENEGYIYRVAGKGSFVSGEHTATDAELLGLLKRFDECSAKLIFRGVTPEELTERLNRTNREVRLND